MKVDTALLRMMRLIRCGIAHWSRPVSALRLRLFECTMTLALLVDTGWRFLHWKEALTDWGFHPSPDEMWQMGFIRAFPLPPPWAIPLIGIGILIAASLVLTNRFRRVGLVGCFVTAVWVYGVDPWTTQALNRILIGTFLILATAPGYFRDSSGRLKVFAAPVHVLQATLVIIYFAAGYTKAYQGDWLKHEHCLWNIVQGYHRTDEAAFLLRHIPVWCWMVMQHSTLVFELGAPVLFAFRYTRLGAAIFGVSLHLGIAILLKRLYFFSFVMISFYWLFLPDTWIHELEKNVRKIFRTRKDCGSAE